MDILEIAVSEVMAEDDDYVKPGTVYETPNGHYIVE
ncbi:hypothetical protein HCTV-8_gp104 [Haloarcula virus HCTV-8]|jgi:hypothetical protein|uniref:Uncharacterized protein n=6 Tax=Haloferacalesvirus TaxID=2843389 RepID=A0AAE9BW94_9CAUD|nr:hypothetical protein M194_gp018 [Halorubrum tailed phage 5]YP_010358066.1 hypothetical protein M1M36_gp018 [Halorubrum tailed virus 10]UBF19444.1 hypothetical protein HRTV-19_gp118 [Halorubrum virus HRTV-19]UBF19573.1 hypothetical protein HRTV-23_gp118 [Halorubrum virus HRTV-23]UBF19821.1 hypothetical protein HRTV-18_gp112 [Halorubrum virus HRTV-18]UBF19944.1 hypothetical protein HRTV-20_gp112 [Halorubrum virus HRTV-20]UBF20196.1 hypothetical protein HRTV-26_gp115 [Halorubrum virus HRTV-26